MEVKIAGKGYKGDSSEIAYRKCGKCHTTKEITEYYLTGANTKKYRSKVCKECEKKKNRETFKAINKEPFWEKLFIGKEGIHAILKPYFS